MGITGNSTLKGLVLVLLVGNIKGTCVGIIGNNRLKALVLVLLVTID